MKSYRGYKASTPMSSWGHAMFNDDGSGAYGYGDTLYSVEKSDLVDINTLLPEIEEAIELAGEEVQLALNGYSVEDQFNPDDMIIDAGAYDNDTLYDWFWNTIVEPKNIAGIATYNGAIVFDESLITKEGLTADFEF